MKKFIAVFVAISSISIAALAFLPGPQNTLIEKIFVEPTYNSLSGREGSDGEILVVKIDDTTQAHPQIGLEDADVVYIEQVEGGLTRLAAVFSSVIPQLSFCPTGGIGLANYKDFLALPNVACVGGSWIAPAKLIDEGNWEEIKKLASNVNMENK